VVGAGINCRVHALSEEGVAGGAVGTESLSSEFFKGSQKSAFYFLF
jgi:hypothetical protein